MSWLMHNKNVTIHMKIMLYELQILTLVNCKKKKNVKKFIFLKFKVRFIIHLRFKFLIFYRKFEIYKTKKYFHIIMGEISIL